MGKTKAPAPDMVLKQVCQFKQWKKGMEVLDRSLMNVNHTGHQNRTAMSVMWQQAPSSDLYRKKLPAALTEDGHAKLRTSKNGKVIDKRANRALTGHAIKALASGAAAAVAAEAAAVAERMRCNVQSEYSVYPMLPLVTPGAGLKFEAAVCAYAQELFGTALTLKEVTPGCTKVTARCAQAACDIVNAKLNASTGFMPTTIKATIPSKLLDKDKKAKEKAKKEQKKKEAEAEGAGEA